MTIAGFSEKIWDKYPEMQIADIVFKDHAMTQHNLDIVPNLFKTKFFVVAMQPTNMLEICRLFCKTCQGTYSFKDFEDQKNNVVECPACLKGNT